MTFYGNPNSKITAIVTSGGIACSRTSGQTPCFIQVSASAITCTGTIVDTAGNNLAAHSVTPYEDLECTWDFGDPSGTEIFTNPATGVAVNANSAQVGPEAVYCYRSAGTFTITLTIRGKNGSGFTIAQVTQNITVTAFNASGGTLYFDSVDGLDANNGLTTLTPKQTITAINTAITTANRAIFLKRGSHWSGATGIDISNFGTPTRIDVYGTGADPIVDVTSGTNCAFRMTNGGSSSPRPRTDFVMSNVVLRRSGSNNVSIFDVTGGNATATKDNLYFDHCTFTSNTSASIGKIFVHLGSNHGVAEYGYGFWGGQIRSEAGDAATGIGLLVGFDQWGFFIGFSIEGTGSDANLDHHIYPSIANHALFRWIQFGDGPSRNYCVNGNHDESPFGSFDTANYWLIADNEFTGTSNGVDGSNHDNNPNEVQFSNYVVQGNAFHDLSGSCTFFYCVVSGTWRDNRVWRMGGLFVQPGTDGAPSLPDLIRMKIYRNYRHSTGSSENTNLNYGNVTYTSPQQITDNIFHHTSLTSKFFTAVAADQQSAGTLIDRNQYWLPNDTDQKSWFDVSTAKTFAQWQAFGFDVNGSVSDPHWLDPANGDFTPFRRRVRLTATA